MLTAFTIGRPSTEGERDELGLALPIGLLPLLELRSLCSTFTGIRTVERPRLGNGGDRRPSEAVGGRMSLVEDWRETGVGSLSRIDDGGVGRTVPEFAGEYVSTLSTPRMGSETGPAVSKAACFKMLLPGVVGTRAVGGKTDVGPACADGNVPDAVRVGIP